MWFSICRIWDASFIIRHTHWFTKPTHKEIHKTLFSDTQVAQHTTEIAIKYSAACFFSVSLNFAVLTLQLLTKPPRKDMVCNEHCGSRIRSKTVKFCWPPQRCTSFGNVDNVEFCFLFYLEPHGTRLRHHRYMAETSRGHGRTMAGTSPRHVWNNQDRQMTETSQKQKGQDQDMAEKPPKHKRNVTTTTPAHDSDITVILTRTWPRHFRNITSL